MKKLTVADYSAVRAKLQAGSSVSSVVDSTGWSERTVRRIKKYSTYDAYRDSYRQPKCTGVITDDSEHYDVFLSLHPRPSMLVVAAKLALGFAIVSLFVVWIKLVFGV